MTLTRACLVFLSFLGPLAGPALGQPEPEPESSDDALRPVTLEEAEPHYFGEPVWLQVRDARFEDILLGLFEEPGLGVIVGPAAHDVRLDVTAREEPWDQVLSRLVSEHGTPTHFTGRAMVIPSAREPSVIGGCEITSTAHFLRAGADPVAVEETLRNIVGERGSVSTSAVEGVVLLTSPIARIGEAQSWLEESAVLDEDDLDSDPRGDALAAYAAMLAATEDRELRRESEERRRRRKVADLRVESIVAAAVKQALPEPVPSSAAPPPAVRSVDSSGGQTIEFVELDEGLARSWEPECKFLTWPEDGFERHRLSALEVLEQLPPSNCSMEALPEAIEVLRGCRLSLSLAESDAMGTIEGVSLACGLWTDSHGSERGWRFLTEKP